jgi:(p)ppGpp synthase/HD superfamily hydrolase
MSNLLSKKIDKKKYKKALDFTYKIHFKQNRKGTGIPYFTHLVSVSNNIIEDGGTTDEAKSSKITWIKNYLTIQEKDIKNFL